MLTYMGVLKIYQITVFSSGSVQLCNNECPVRRPNFSINLLIYNLLVFFYQRGLLYIQYCMIIWLKSYYIKSQGYSYSNLKMVYNVQWGQAWNRCLASLVYFLEPTFEKWARARNICTDFIYPKLETFAQTLYIQS